MTGLCFVFPILLFMIVAIVVSMLSRQNRESKKAAWQRLAKIHNLQFVPDRNSFGDGAYVMGFYRDHSLRLETVEKGQRKSRLTYCTRLTVFAHPWDADRQANGQSKQTLSFQEALNRFTSPAPSIRSALNEIEAGSGGQLIAYEQPDVIQDTKFLEHLFNLLTDLAEAYPVVVALGGEAIPALRPVFANKTLGQIAVQLLRDIAQETSRRLAHRALSLLCPRCLTRFGPHEVHLAWCYKLTYYGCRTCSQSRDFYEGSVVAMLNRQKADAPVQQNGIIRVNWSTRRELFDFDAVEIVQASDEEVERFAVQVGNDTDETRESRYQEMQCVVHPNCQLSENTLRILEHTFGQVISGNEGGWQIKKESRMNSGLLTK